MKTYTLTEAERTYLLTVRGVVAQAALAVREAQVALKATEDDEARVKTTFDGGLKLLLNAQGMTRGGLSDDFSTLTEQGQ